MFENPRTGRQARNFTTNVSKILDLKSSFEQIFSENWRWVPRINQGPVVQKVDNAIHRINLYPVDSAIGFPNIYPLDSNLSGG